MATINDLISQIDSVKLRERIQKEVDTLSRQKEFGLVKRRRTMDLLISNCNNILASDEIKQYVPGFSNNQPFARVCNREEMIGLYQSIGSRYEKLRFHRLYSKLHAMEHSPRGTVWKLRHKMRPEHVV